jgi:hypothetical protein
MKRPATVAIVTLLLCNPTAARADAVLDWNEIAVTTLLTQPAPGVSPFAQARLMSIVQLAVFEAVNAIEKDYEPYRGPVVARAGASADAAAIAAAYSVLKNYFPGSAATLKTAYDRSLAAIPDGPGEQNGVATGEAAAARMIAARADDGSDPATFYAPSSSGNGAWQMTSACPESGGLNFQWQKVTPFGIPSAPGSQAWLEQFLPGPPPDVTSDRYTKDYAEVRRVGSVNSNSTDRPADRADVARFYASSSPSLLFNLAARQVAVAKGTSLSENARALALLNMATSDSFVASFATKYRYRFWRPETAIRAGKAKADPDSSFAPFLPTPCFPSYPSNHASGSDSAAEILRRVYGAGGHAIMMANPAVPGVTLRYTTFKQITDDVDDARVYGGMHFRFDQEAGTQLGRKIATYIYENNLRKVSGSN